jgi:hypothetical protein
MFSTVLALVVRSQKLNARHGDARGFREAATIATPTDMFSAQANNCLLASLGIEKLGAQSARPSRVSEINSVPPSTFIFSTLIGLCSPCFDLPALSPLPISDITQAKLSAKPRELSV